MSSRRLLPACSWTKDIIRYLWQSRIAERTREPTRSTWIACMLLELVPWTRKREALLSPSFAFSTRNVVLYRLLKPPWKSIKEVESHTKIQNVQESIANWPWKQLATGTLNKSEQVRCPGVYDTGIWRMSNVTTNQLVRTKKREK